MATEQEVEALADAMWQLLDDMRGCQSVSLWAKAQARIAFEPFNIDKPPLEYAGWMSLDEARRIIAESQAG